MSDNLDTSGARRDFLKKCGKFAAVTPPAVALMLSATQQGYAQAISGGGSAPPGGGHGHGHGHGGTVGHHHGHGDGRGHHSRGHGRGHFDRGHHDRHPS